MAPAYQLQREIGGSKTLRRARVRDLGDGIEDGDHADRRGNGLGLRCGLLPQSTLGARNLVVVAMWRMLHEIDDAGFI